MNENALLDVQVLALDQWRGEIMLRWVHDFLGRFVAYPAGHAHTAHALWVVQAHLMDKWDSTPRLAFLSPEPGSGKTRARLRARRDINWYSRNEAPPYSVSARSMHGMQSLSHPRSSSIRPSNGTKRKRPVWVMPF
jgi:hypothetical protein